MWPGPRYTVREGVLCCRGGQLKWFAGGGITVPRRGTWVFAPDSGGNRIPEPVKLRTEQRIRRYAEEYFAGRYTRLDIRFRGQFCYIDAYMEPEPLGPDWPPPDWPESREEMF